MPLEKIVASARIPSIPQWKKTDPQNPKSIWAFSDAPFLGFRIVRPVARLSCSNIDLAQFAQGTNLPMEFPTDTWSLWSSKSNQDAVRQNIVLRY